MREEISALMDAELDEGAELRALDHAMGGAESRESWDTYHLIGDVMRGDLSLPPAAMARFAARLAAEPTVLCPGAIRQRAAEMPVAWAAAAAVAGVAVVVAAAVGMQPQRNIDLASLDSVSTSRPGAAGSPGAVVSGQEYLLAHQAVSTESALNGFSQYARTVAALHVEWAGR